MKYRYAFTIMMTMTTKMLSLFLLLLPQILGIKQVIRTHNEKLGMKIIIKLSNNYSNNNYYFNSNNNIINNNNKILQRFLSSSYFELSEQ